MPASSFGGREVFWRELIERRESMRLTVREVCEEAGVSQGSFFQWQKRLGGRKHPPGYDAGRTAPLMPVRIVDDRSSGLTLELPNGLRVLIPQGCDEDTLQRVVRVAMAATRGTEPC